MAQRRRSIYATALRHRDFRWLISGFAVSSTGDLLYVVALAALVWDRTASAAWVSAAVVLRQVPLVVLPPLAGALADRVDRRRLLIALNAGMAVVMAGMALLAAGNGPVWALVALAVALNCLATPLNPASTGLLPDLVPESDLAAANAVQASVDAVALLLGPALGAAALLLGSPALAFAVNAVTFIGAAVCLLQVHRRSSAPPRTGAANSRADTDTDADLDRDGPSVGGARPSAVRVLAGDRPLLVITGAVVAACFSLGATGVLFVVVSTKQLDAGSAGLGWLLAGVGLGGLIGVQAADRLAEGTAVGRAVIGCLLLAGASLVLMPLAGRLAVAIVLAVVFGAGYLVTEVLLTTFTQRALDASLLGRATGIIDAAAYGALLLGALVAGVVVEAGGLAAGLVVAGAVPLVVAAAGWSTAAAADTAARAGVQQERPLVDLLMAAPVLAGAERPAVERLAAASHVERFPSGTAVVRQGEPALDLWVVVSGRLGVTVSERDAGSPALPELGPGDSFGEIGLLRAGPRTATVTALEPVELVSVPGAEFLQVVTGSTRLLDAFGELAATRLARSRSVAA